MIYFDNAATTFPKPRYVYRELQKCVTQYCGNPGRSAHRLAIKSAEKVYETRERISALTHFSTPENIVFTQNATHALNLAIKSQIREKCHVIVSDLEHNSVLRPLYKLSRDIGIEISVYDSDLPLESAITPLIRPDTKAIITTIASNVTGKVISPFEIYMLAKQNNLYSIIDASQYIGHLPLNLEDTPFDVICAPGHKGLFGIQGSGFAIFKSTNDINTIIEGGSGSNSLDEDMPTQLPERLEAGTLNTPSIVSLNAGISFIEAYGEEEIQNKINVLTARLSQVLHESDVIVHGCENGIASFNIPGISAAKIARLLADKNIATRSGLHCAPLVHSKIDCCDHGTVRASLSIFNSFKEIDELYLALKEISK